MCNCTAQKIKTQYSVICSECGSETPFLVCDFYNVFSAPIQKNYSRSHRFQQKVKKLLLIDSTPKSSDKIWQYLESNRVDLVDVASIRKKLREATHIKQKHYDSIRLFYTVFCGQPRLIISEPHKLLDRIMQDFDDIFVKWSGYYQDGLFFSSDWLLRRIVSNHCPELMCFLKPATSASRNSKYEKMLQTISIS